MENQPEVEKSQSIAVRSVLKVKCIFGGQGINFLRIEWCVCG